VKHRPISQVAKRAEAVGMLICPNCGGTQFKARRSGARRLGIAATGIVIAPLGAAAAAAIAKKNRVECVTCGKQFGRG
jgi:hypothetical protein